MARSAGAARGHAVVALVARGLIAEVGEHVLPNRRVTKRYAIVERAVEQALRATGHRRRIRRDVTPVTSGPMTPCRAHAWHGVIQYKRGERKVVKGEAPGAMPGWVTPQEARRRNLKPAAPERRCRHCGRGLEARGIVYGGRAMWIPTEECPCPAAAVEREREERERRAREREDWLHRCGIGTRYLDAKPSDPATGSEKERYVSCDPLVLDDLGKELSVLPVVSDDALRSAECAL